MQKILLTLTLMYLSFGFAQSYFQQEVNYKIDVTLNDNSNTLSAFEEFEYINNAPCELEYLYIHVWPNAYKNTETALAKQLYRLNNDALANASEEGRGYIDSLDFKVNGETVKWEYDPEHIDIVKLYLNTPVGSGKSIKVSTPFKVKVPSGSISRLGHVGESYQITQWYPKPAVYDRNGWHQMPYLTQGEFYSEYGSFEVSITLPKNYVVGATGDLQTQSEIDFLNDNAERTKLKFESNGYTNHNKPFGRTPFPKSDSLFKTITYTQQNVHDFAWFADKRFDVLKGEVELPHSKRKVTSWAMFVPHHAQQWKDAIEYLNDGTYYYSKWNGDYQYNQVTAVDGTISAGGGMEYPNVTVIGNASSKQELEVVIVHEVGHNWFYGMIGSNERDHPWMDEGLNTLNEIRYIETKYPENTQTSDMFRGLAEKIHLEHLSHHDMSDYTYSVTGGYGLDQPIELHSDDYTSMNYGGIVYSKTGLVFTYLKDYLGDEMFDNCMRAYFDKWHFKHPQPQDLRQVIEEVSGKNLSWLFDEIIPTTKQIDYKLKRVKQDENGTEVTVKNTGHVDGPMRVDVYSLGKHRSSAVVEPGQKKSTVVFPERSIDEVRIDGKQRIPEVNRNNNNWHKKGLFGKIEPINLEFLAGDNDPNKTTIWAAPIAAYNVYDKFMLGIGIHNYTIPKNKFEYVLAPMFSFGRKNFSGYGGLKYSLVPARNFKTITLGLRAKTFGFEVKDSTLSYIAINPYINLTFGKPKARTNINQSIRIQGAYNIESGLTPKTIIGGFARYEFYFKKGIHQFSSRLRTDYISEMDENVSVVNAHVYASYKLTYLESKGKDISISTYFGKNLMREGAPNIRYGLALGGQSGTQDVFYENFMFARNVTTGLGSQRRNFNQGNFNTVSKLTFGNHLFTTNLFLEIPYVPLIGAFVDYGLVSYSTGLANYFQGGIGVRLLDGNIGIYMPLFESDTILDAHINEVDNVWKKVRFTFNLSNLTLDKVINGAF